MPIKIKNYQKEKSDIVMTTQEAFHAMINHEAVILLSSDTSGITYINSITSTGWCNLQPIVGGVSKVIPEVLSLCPKYFVFSHGEEGCSFNIYHDREVAAKIYSESTGPTLIAKIEESKN